ncbi:DgyrCDS3266 [Dimorphilus gyrociliatus]|uniref:DgyrCDS3266 n=1 Tax=Dimorphilus gyrociliatus TaxID=2664684 RepID=A0A7I8VEH2_9ANNE|nr:DgyrCDS3266 [Dimorphilus gyrociliatus]
MVDIIILATWHIIDPIKKERRELSPQVDGEEDDLEIIPILEYCSCSHMTIWIGTVYAFKGLLLVVGCFLAWETRHVTMPALNDSKYIGMSVYNIVIMCISGAAISVLISHKVDASFRAEADRVKERSEGRGEESKGLHGQETSNEFRRTVKMEC